MPIDQRERKFKHWFRDHMSSAFLMEFHEDKYTSNIADASFVSKHHMGFTGWIEFKALAKEPLGHDRPLLLPKFTMGQRIWLQNRSNLGQIGFLCLYIEQTDRFIMVPSHWVRDFFHYSWANAQALGNSFNKTYPAFTISANMLKSKMELTRLIKGKS